MDIGESESVEINKQWYEFPDYVEISEFFETQHGTLEVVLSPEGNILGEFFYLPGSPALVADSPLDRQEGADVRIFPAWLDEENMTFEEYFFDNRNVKTRQSTLTDGGGSAGFDENGEGVYLGDGKDEGWVIVVKMASGWDGADNGKVIRTYEWSGVSANGPIQIEIQGETENGQVRVRRHVAEGVVSVSGQFRARRGRTVLVEDLYRSQNGENLDDYFPFGGLRDFVQARPTTQNRLKLSWLQKLNKDGQITSAEALMPEVSSKKIRLRLLEGEELIRSYMILGYEPPVVLVGKVADGEYRDRLVLVGVGHQMGFLGCEVVPEVLFAEVFGIQPRFMQLGEDVVDFRKGMSKN